MASEKMTNEAGVNEEELHQEEVVDDQELDLDDHDDADAEKADHDDADAEKAVEDFFASNGISDYDDEDDESGDKSKDEAGQGDEAGGLTAQEQIAATHLGVSAADAARAKKETPELFNKLIGQAASQLGSDTEQLLAQAQQGGGQQGDHKKTQHGNDQQQGAKVDDEDESDALMREIYGGDDGLKKLKEVYGEDVGGIVQPIIKHLAKELAPMRQEHQARAIEQVRQTATAFFNSVPKEYQNFYGNEDNKMTAEQIEHRNQLAQQADEIRMASMSVRGQDMGVQEALARAHEIVSAKFAKELARNEIKNELRQRTGSRTHRPSHRSGTSANGKSDKSAVAAVAAKMRAFDE